MPITSQSGAGCVLLNVAVDFDIMWGKQEIIFFSKGNRLNVQLLLIQSGKHIEKQASLQRIWRCNTMQPRRVHDWLCWVPIHINAFLFWYCFIFFFPTNCHNKKIPFALKLQSVFLVFLFFGGRGRDFYLSMKGKGKKKKKTSCQKGWAGAAANCGSVRVRWITKKPRKRAQLSNPKQANFEWNSTIWDCDVDCLPPINLF